MYVKIASSWRDVPAQAWDKLVGDGSPFLESAFIGTLEALGCAVPATGWTPRPVLVYDEAGELIGGAPAWKKTHSMGEFVYDHGWADAARRAGSAYYPKLVVAVPFTPVSGDRLLVRPGTDPIRAAEVRKALVAGLLEASRDTTGIHVLFNPQAEVADIEPMGFFPRLQFQYHFENEGWSDFEGYLSGFKSKDRSEIRRERKSLAGLDIAEVFEPGPEVLTALHRFYARTCAQFGPWGQVYLSKDVYLELGRIFGHRLHAVVARRDGEIIAGAFNLHKAGRLYGRTWGCDETVKNLHFEVCYYQAIDAVLRHGWEAFEPGHGGEHKYTRGFVPTYTWSSHRLHEIRLHDAFKRYCVEERAAVIAEAEVMRLQGPRKAPAAT